MRRVDAPLVLFDDALRLAIVTGPPRAGTTIAARIIAADLDWTYVDEDAYNVHDEGRWRQIVDTPDRLVVHSPAMMLQALRLDPADWRQTIVVRRDVGAIGRSRARVGGYWADLDAERARIGCPPDVDPAAFLYQAWVDADPDRRGTMIDYMDLAAHPLWVPARERLGWSTRQTARA